MLKTIESLREEELFYFPIKNGTTLSVGDVVIVSSGGVVDKAGAAATDCLGVVVGFTDKNSRVLGTSTTTQATGDASGTYWAAVVPFKEGTKFVADFSASIATHSVFATYSLTASGNTLDAAGVKNPGDAGFPLQFMLVEKTDNSTQGVVVPISRRL